MTSSTSTVEIFEGDLFGLWPRLARSCDGLVFDAPYSDVTVKGHNEGMADCKDGHDRGLIGYEAWGLNEIERFCRLIVPTCHGWTVSITDDLLGPWWRFHFEHTSKRYAFHGVPAIVPGSRFRKQGDGPPCVSYLCYAARPRKAAFIGGWSPAGYYLVDPESRRGEDGIASRIRGEKPVGLLVQIIRDYVRSPGSVILDPCCGRGSTLVAAHSLGHRAVGIEKDPGTFKLLQERLRADGIPFEAHPCPK